MIDCKSVAEVRRDCVLLCNILFVERGKANSKYSNF